MKRRLPAPQRGLNLRILRPISGGFGPLDPFAGLGLEGVKGGFEEGDLRGCEGVVFASAGCVDGCRREG